MKASKTVSGKSLFKLGLDVGPGAIGWSMLKITAGGPVEIAGTGAVIFEADSALASSRRQKRSLRRHVRATRQRMDRLAKLLCHIGAIPAAMLTAKHRAGGGSPCPWLMAASVLASDGVKILSWPELWDVLRWYAHNRGYEDMTIRETKQSDGAAKAAIEAEKNTEKVENAKAALAQYKTTTMAETICKVLNQDPLAPRTGTTESYKAKNMAFPRETVRDEVIRILAAHRGKLPGVDEKFIATVMLDARITPVPELKLPKRYEGGLLFGRLAMRYDNSILRICPITGTKTPNKKSLEFLRFRWAEVLANITLGASDQATRPLNKTERAAVHLDMLKEGYLDVSGLKLAVRNLPGWISDNLDQFFMHPDSREMLILDPVEKFIHGHKTISAVWPILPSRLQARLRRKWRRAKSSNLPSIREEAKLLGGDIVNFDAIVEGLVTEGTKTKGKKVALTRTAFLNLPLDARRELTKLDGRAPYERKLMQKAADEIMAGGHPRGKGGCLEETEAIRQRRDGLTLDQQTNNHMVRHRLAILQRLVEHLIADPAYCNGDATSIESITVEVNRDLQTMSGLTNKEKAMAMGLRLHSTKAASAHLEENLPAGTNINGSLIRKAVIAMDLDWTCPYTGKKYDAIDLVNGRVDKDHIIPRSQRQTDSLSSLAITFSEVNKWKGNRTSSQFIGDVARSGSAQVPDASHLSLFTPAQFEAHAGKLNTRGSPDDQKRKRARKEWLLLEQFNPKAQTFTEGQLTQTSQLGRLAARAVLVPFTKRKLESPQVISVPGSVTGTVRRSWNLLGCLAQAMPAVLEADGSVKTKTEIRDITHLHHALDASVLALVSHFIPNRGDVWRLISARRVSERDMAQLAALDMLDFDNQGQFRLRDLDEKLKKQISAKLQERRVVQHVPADMSGMSVEENIRGIVRVDGETVTLTRRSRSPDGKLVTNVTTERSNKVIGMVSGGKLAALNGVLVLNGNYGVAILAPNATNAEPRFVVVPHERVWKRLQAIRAENGGKMPIVVRRGQIIDVPEGIYKGRWSVRSVKDNAGGVALDISLSDYISAAKAGSKFCKINVSLRTLIKCRMRVAASWLTGTLR